MTDIRQSPQFAVFMQSLGWRAEQIRGTFIYIRKFPLIGSFAKIPRFTDFAVLNDLRPLIRTYRIFHLKLSPFLPVVSRKYAVSKILLAERRFSIDMEPFNPTTTIRIDLKQTEKELFAHFISAKRRAVRRAQKHAITVVESSHYDAFVAIRKQQYAPAGFLIEKEMRMLWRCFSPKKAKLLLAYPSEVKQFETTAQKSLKCAVGGILLLFFDTVAYYWFASATPEGKKLFAPTLLVWEALKLSKKRGCTLFDFEGIADTRFPKASKPWQGFTKFKEGFGGETITLAENFTRFRLPF